MGLVSEAVVVRERSRWLIVAVVEVDWALWGRRVDRTTVVRILGWSVGESAPFRIRGAGFAGERARGVLLADALEMLLPPKADDLLEVERTLGDLRVAEAGVALLLILALGRNVEVTSEERDDAWSLSGDGGRSIFVREEGLASFVESL